MEIVSAEHLNSILAQILPSNTSRNLDFTKSLDACYILIQHYPELQPAIRWTNEGVWQVSVEGSSDVYAPIHELPIALSEAIAGSFYSTTVRLNRDHIALQPSESNRRNQFLPRSGTAPEPSA